MSLKSRRVAALIATVATVGALAAAVPSQAAIVVTPKFTNWIVSGTLTAKKSDQTVTLPEGSTFNGSGEISLEESAGVVLANGTITGSVFVPPFSQRLTLPILGIPTAVSLGVTFDQVGQTEGTVKPATGCAEPGACVTVTAPTKVNVGFTAVSILGIKVPIHCETIEPVNLPLSTNLTILELITKGSHFTGTTTIPPIFCPGLQGITLSILLTTALSGPDNPFSISISPPPPPPA